ncbi:MAG: hypothetical protein U9R48_08815 [Chloroflexota bacterium]|nr:hypothetical protein [Chloroflexota bacterium]
MQWFRILIIVFDLYLLGSLGAWFALRFLLWRLQRLDIYATNGETRLQELEEVLEHQAALWPAQPRPGRYHQLDRQAQQDMENLRQVAAQIQERWPATVPAAPASVTFTQALRFCAWPPLCRTLMAWQQCRKLRQLLNRGETLLAALEDAERHVSQIPDEAHASLCEVRAEARRIAALLEAEAEAGTSGLEDAEQQLQAISKEINQSLETLAKARGDNLAGAVYEADQMLENTMPRLEELADLMERTARARSRTENVAERVQSSVALARERWEGLKARGAAEPSVQRELMGLNEMAQKVTQTAEKRTVQAYRRVTKDVSHFDETFQSLSEKLDQLDELMEQSRETIKGDVQALAQAQSRCDDLRKKHPLLDPDKSCVLIEEAAEAYIEAERQHGLGTMAGYQSAITLSEKARRQLQEANEALDNLVEGSDRVRDILDQLSSEAIGEWHERVHRLREAVQVYTVHWERDLAEKAGQAISKLEQVSMDLERVPPDARYKRSFRQTELPEALNILSHAQACLQQAQELTRDLEQEKQHIESLRAELDSQMETLIQETWPDLESKKEQMLPELRERVEALHQEFIAQRRKVEIPSQVDYYEAHEVWLPSLTSQLTEILEAHKSDVERYQSMAREAERTLQRTWAQLNRLRPYEQPMPQEDIDVLGADLENWRAAVEANAQNPAALRAVVGRQAAALQERMGNAQNQIREGRSRLNDLSKGYQRAIKQIYALRSSIREMEENSQWPQITWEVTDAEDLWEQAVALERESATASTLREANNELQEAVNTAQKAQELYGRVESRMSRALRQLNDELRAVERRLARGYDRVQSLQKDGLPDDATEISEICDRAERRIEMATSASSFEDALRHLREARDILARL